MTSHLFLWIQYSTTILNLMFRILFVSFLKTPNIVASSIPDTIDMFVLTTAGGLEQFRCGPYVFSVAIVVALWILWRVWRFSILPILKPHEPKELPYWIPCKLCSLTDWFQTNKIRQVIGNDLQWYQRQISSTKLISKDMPFRFLEIWTEP